MTCRRPIWLLLAGLSMAGCQTDVSPPPAALVTAGGEIGVPSSNELNRLGRQELSAGAYGSAEKSFRQAVEANSDDLASWIGLAAAYDNLTRFDLADRAYENAVRIGGETLTVLNNRGYSFLLRGDRRRALAQFRRALALDPRNAVILNNIRLLPSMERPTRGAAP